jgi:alpha-tubulin suppressor-like RCC1 family protein
VNFTSVAAGDCFSLALTYDRQTIYSFGRSDYGQLGIGARAAITKRSYPSPQVVQFHKAVLINSIEAGDRHAMALTADHELYTWGFNEEGTTGHQRTGVAAQYADTYYPTLLKLDVQPESIPVQCSGGGQHSLILARP